MPEDAHERAAQLMDKLQVEGLSNEERVWLEAQLEECADCRRRAHQTEQALGAFRSAVPRFDLALTLATQTRVRMRARQLIEDAVRMRALWISCLMSWALGVVSAPLLWRAFEWIGYRLAISKAAWITGFALSWLVPAAVAAAVIAWRHAHEDEWRVTIDK